MPIDICIIECTNKSKLKEIEGKYIIFISRTRFSRLETRNLWKILRINFKILLLSSWTGLWWFNNRCLNNLGWTILIQAYKYAIHDNYCVKICYVLFRKKIWHLNINTTTQTQQHLIIQVPSSSVTTHNFRRINSAKPEQHRYHFPKHIFYISSFTVYYNHYNQKQINK